MKLITFAVPCYNSQEYMDKCVKSLLVAGEDAEIIIIDDGSTDRTAEIADQYASEYPSIVRAVHKANGGHGSGVNKGIELASGLYYKVVDSDDWLDEDALKEFLFVLREHVQNGEGADLYICNFVYDKVADGKRYVSEYTKKLPSGRFFTWNEIKTFRLWKMLLMHSIAYRTEALRESGLSLPEHTFYVDNLYAYQPLPYMKKLFYLNVNLYHYYIGRSEQSVTVENMTKRYAQQILVMRLMLKAYSAQQIRQMPKSLKKMCYHILTAIMLNTTFFTTAMDSPERRREFYGMWKELKQHDKKLYRKLRRHTLYALINPLPWKLKGRVTTRCYRFLCKRIKLG